MTEPSDSRVGPLVSVGRIPAPSRRVFEERYVASSTPVVLTNLVSDWPARTRWTPDYLKARCGGRTVLATPTRRGMMNHDAQRGIVFERIALGGFVDALARDPQPATYVTCALDEYLPELADDVRPIDYTEGALWSRQRVWFGPADAASPMHRDLPDNLYVQLYGRKRMFLFPRAESSRMYPYPWYSSLPHCARVDAEKPDLERFPAFGGAYGVTVVLDPGDVLYLPSLWWHQARTLETSISVNVWWTSRRPMATILRAAEMYKRARNLSL